MPAFLYSSVAYNFGITTTSTEKTYKNPLF